MTAAESENEGEPAGRIPAVCGAGLAAIETLCWWVACTGVWVATLGTVTTPELVAATSAALPCAVLARAGRRAMRLRARIPARAWLWLALVPIIAVTDLGRVVRWAGRVDRDYRVSSWLVVRALPVGESPRATGWRAVAIAAVSATPGTLVLDLDPGTGNALMHAIVRSAPAIDVRVAQDGRRQGKGAEH
jgi:hypothetical protein